MKIEKYLKEENENFKKDREYFNLVSDVSQKIKWRGDLAAEFIYDLLTDINFHSEAKNTYNFLMNKIRKGR